MHTKLLPFFPLVLLLAGCAAPSETTSQPKPGRGIAEYRQITREAHRAVDATVDSLEALARDSQALPKFDRAFDKLELTSVKVRARAEAIIARGQSYFDEWKGNLAGITNQSAARIEKERYDHLFKHFERVRQRSGEVSAEFRPFMGSLRTFRARIDKSAKPADAGLDAVTASGKRVLRALDSVITALNDAEAELHAKGTL